MLTYFFIVLNHTRLGCEHPNYHMLLTTLFQILHDIILNVWRVKSGYSSLAAFALSNPFADDLIQIANKIIWNHAALSHQKPVLKNKTMIKAIKSSDPEVNDDTAWQNLCLLTHDLLYIHKLMTAVSHRDFGCIKDILGNLTMIFHGAGSNNYTSEILH